MKLESISIDTVHNESAILLIQRFTLHCKCSTGQMGNDSMIIATVTPSACLCQDHFYVKLAWTEQRRKKCHTIRGEKKWENELKQCAQCSVLTAVIPHTHSMTEFLFLTFSQVQSDACIK